jgi:hypothetical protein
MLASRSVEAMVITMNGKVVRATAHQALIAYWRACLVDAGMNVLRRRFWCRTVDRDVL